MLTLFRTIHCCKAFILKLGTDWPIGYNRNRNGSVNWKQVDRNRLSDGMKDDGGGVIVKVTMIVK